MIAHPTPQGQVLLEYSWHEALVASGSAETDSELIKDELLTQWLAGRPFIVVSNNKNLVIEQLIQQGIEIVITKSSTDV
jgi:hypothetical protein